MSDFQKSKFCGDGACVEVAMEFNKASHCEGGACVEVAFEDPVKSSFCSDSACVEMGNHDENDVVFIRNTTDPSNVVGFPKGAWRAFLREVRDGTTLIDKI